MEAVIFCGIQGSGKTTFYRERFFDTHVRINLDMLRTRHREAVLLRACVEAQQPFVVDNTNPTADERGRYVRSAKAAHFRVVGYFFEATPRQAIGRNKDRPAREQIPVVGILGASRTSPPAPAAARSRTSWGTDRRSYGCRTTLMQPSCFFWKIS